MKTPTKIIKSAVFASQRQLLKLSRQSNLRVLFFEGLLRRFSSSQRRELQKFLLAISPISLALFLVPLSTYAVCPVCVVAVGAGVGFSRWLGIDDSITGIWIGGLTLSIIIWNINWFQRKNIKFPSRNILTFLAYYVLILVSLRWSNFIGHPINKLWGMDKILLGMTIGTIFFALGNFYYTYLKNKNNGHSYFPFQKVVMPIASLLIVSLVFYIITK